MMLDVSSVPTDLGKIEHYVKWELEENAFRVSFHSFIVF